MRLLAVFLEDHQEEQAVRGPAAGLDVRDEIPVALDHAPLVVDDHDPAQPGRREELRGGEHPVRRGSALRHVYAPTARIRSASVRKSSGTASPVAALVARAIPP